MGQNNVTGHWGEDVAARFLRRKFYRIIARGYRSRYGEIDIIAAKGGYLAFVEVKVRRSDRFAEAREFVDFRKQERLRKTAADYLRYYPTSLQPRFDVIEIYAAEGTETRKPIINHLEDAFE